jgi:hypothetical protein
MMNLPDKIQASTSERPRFDDGMKRCCKNHLDITKFLTFFAPFVVPKAIKDHGMPIESGPSQ